MKSYFNLEDLSQVLIGAFALAVPISFSEEAWQLGASLPFSNLLMLMTLSIFFLALFCYYSLFQGNVLGRVGGFVLRIILAYLVTFVVVMVVLASLDKLPLLAEPIIALKRAIVITMPASMGAIMVDSFDKE